MSAPALCYPSGPAYRLPSGRVVRVVQRCDDGTSLVSDVAGHWKYVATADLARFEVLA